MKKSLFISISLLLLVLNFSCSKDDQIDSFEDEASIQQKNPLFQHQAMQMQMQIQPALKDNEVFFQFNQENLPEDQRNRLRLDFIKEKNLKIHSYKIINCSQEIWVKCPGINHDCLYADMNISSRNQDHTNLYTSLCETRIGCLIPQCGQVTCATSLDRDYVDLD